MPWVYDAVHDCMKFINTVIHSHRPAVHHAPRPIPKNHAHKINHALPAKPTVAAKIPACVKTAGSLIAGGLLFPPASAPYAGPYGGPRGGMGGFPTANQIAEYPGNYYPGGGFPGNIASGFPGSGFTPQFGPGNNSSGAPAGPIIARTIPPSIIPNSPLNQPPTSITPPNLPNIPLNIPPNIPIINTSEPKSWWLLVLPLIFSISLPWRNQRIG